ncbi:SH3 domain-binding glutamic acid-rich-like protein 2 [Corticium candelabrum]|uniref:SH3 domain-binding glutamic acid-rich-like protein 2 n=1 Tax=Corticium candelabrum TaxID=121492 RepID=UPI002E269836|nr:SH3 domain-binding glutamic acid-rich-like protein 2 [Corticium candelabrum]
MSNPIIVYVSTVSSNLEVLSCFDNSPLMKAVMVLVLQIKKQQQKLEMILSSKKVPVDYIDVASSEEAKAEMREKAKDPKALPPQFVHRNHGYLGDYKAFEEALESESLFEFLKYTP